ncbi:hypothetical protein WCE34_06455 [Luteimonas sp. MJ204]|uniref:hypothetical protein n=1 Tax=Luteimonas sp. MJ145 TaxID=3129234 RepID=UPI0031BA7102
MHATTETRAAHEAVTRLFDLSCSGEVDNVEFNQLDSLVYARLLQAYECDEEGLRTGDESIS